MTAGLTPLSLAFLGAAAIAALADWVVVARRARSLDDPGASRAGSRLRFVTKPLVLVLLIGAAVALEPRDPAVRVWFVAALVLSLAGDVALLFARGFVVGLAAFLVAHVAYANGFLVGGVAPVPLVAGLAAMLVADGLLVRRLVPAIRDGGHGELLPPVLAYLAALTAMVATAAGSAIPLAAAGAALFAASDALLADGRFVRPRPRGDVLVRVLYHLAQACLVLSLIA